VTPRTLVLEIVTPDGMAVRDTEVDVVVFHRREARFELGSEIAVFPLHGPLLVRIPVGPVRYHRLGGQHHLAVGGGFAEVQGDRVLITTPRLARVAPEDPDPPGTARKVCRKWREEMGEGREEMIGYS
jgi:F-type H+-transporting ATPase subunit epsilon